MRVKPTPGGYSGKRREQKHFLKDRNVDPCGNTICSLSIYESLLAKTEGTSPPTQLKVARPTQAKFVICDQTIETFFAWWKKHLKVYHLISRNPHGLLVQLLCGLITYLLLVIYFHQRYGQRPCVKCLRQLRWDIRHETQPPTLVHIYLVIQTDTQFSPLIFLWLLNPAIF